MHDFKGLNFGVGITGSYCMFKQIFAAIEKLTKTNANIMTIFSSNAATTDCRFGKSDDFMNLSKELTTNTPITTIVGAEPIGPKSLLDLMLIAPCTGNTIAKLCNGITDTPVLMAAKAHLRNNKPLVIFLSTNDALGMNLKNIGILLNTKNIYFVPFGQDNYKTKPNSMVSYPDLIDDTIYYALKGQQIQPVIKSPK